MDKISLLILAGGMGSRYKGSKQIDTVSDANETLMEFGLYDALGAGISKFVFIINSEFPEVYKTHLTKILESKNAEVHFVVQTIQSFIPDGFSAKLKNRKKPLGTAHAVFCANQLINEVFITINADDYYGRQSFEMAVKSIRAGQISGNTYGMVAFKLENTLSEQGGVSRGICNLKDNCLLHVEEFTSIQKTEDGIRGLNEKNEWKFLNETDLVSMNLWILHPSFFKPAKSGLNEFLKNMADPENSEFYLPSVIDHAVQEEKIKIKVVKSTEKWFGLTYREDKEKVINEIKLMKSAGIYPEKIWGSRL